MLGGSCFYKSSVEVRTANVAVRPLISTLVNAIAAATAKEQIMAKYIVVLVAFLFGCTTPETPDNRLPECEKNLTLSEDALKLAEATNASLRKTIEQNEESHAASLNALCKEGLAKVEVIWETSPVVADAKAHTALPCSLNHTVKMGVIDTKRKITALQIKHADGSFSASRPFSWTSEVDRWHVLTPKVLLEVKSCGASTCELVCHAQVEKVAPLPSCIP